MAEHTKQDKDFKQMHTALKRIGQYMRPDQLRRACEKDYGGGISYHEALEMAYENILQEAKTGIKNVRIPKPNSKING